MLMQAPASGSIPISTGRKWPFSMGAASAAAALYLWLGLVRYASGSSGNYDLGIFTQAAQGWAGGVGPYSEIKGGSLFGDHFSPITVMFGVAYAGWQDPRALILTQASMLALTVGILVQFAATRLSSLDATLVAVLTVVASPFVSAAAFDVHETGLGAPLVAWLCVSLAQRRFAQCMTAAVLCLTVKEDLGLLVLMAGLAWWLLHGGTRRQSMLLGGVGLLGFVVANVVIVSVNAGGESPYLRFLLGASPSPDLAASQPGWERFVPLLISLGLTGAALRRPVLLLAVPTLAWRMLSSNPHYWSYKFHYDAILLPIAIVVLVEVLQSASARRRVVAFAVAIAASIPGVVRIVTLEPWEVNVASVSTEQRSAEQLGKKVPRGAVIVTSQRLGLPLIDTHRVKLLDPGHPTPAQWALVDLRAGSNALARAGMETYVKGLADPGATVVRQGNVALISYDTERPLP